MWHHGRWEEGEACDCPEIFNSSMVARKEWGLDFHLPFKGTPLVTYFLLLGSASYYYLVIVLWAEDPAGQAFEKHPRTEPLQHVIFISDLVTEFLPFPFGP